MKRCPKCSRTFPDENQKFCTFDGGLLMVEQPNFDPNLTVRATSTDLQFPPGVKPSGSQAQPSEPPAPPITPPPAPSAPAASESSEAPTSTRLRDMSETIAVIESAKLSELAATTQETPKAGRGKDTSSDLVLPDSVAASTELTPPETPTPQEPPAPQPPPVEPPPAAAVPVAQPVATTPVSAPLPPQPEPAAAVVQPSSPLPPQPAVPKKKRSVLPWIIAILLVLLILGGGGVVAGYFFFLKPWLAAHQRPVVVAEDNNNENTNSSANTNSNASTENANTNSSANANVETRKGPEPFVPPPDAVQFTNSRASLDGELAAHFVSFSFYYPRIWTKDPKAGVAGATSFAKIDHPFTDETGDYLGERVVFNWYPSQGSVEADMAVYPDSVKKLITGLKLEEVSHGETPVNAYKGYEYRFKGVINTTQKGDLPYWVRVVFLPPANPSEKNGVAIVMLATSLAPGVASAEDIGSRGDLAMILDSFRFGGNP